MGRSNEMEMAAEERNPEERTIAFEWRSRCDADI
jgi:hypothetical protein